MATERPPSSPADDRAAEGQERLVDTGMAVEPRSQSAELVQQGQRLFDDVSQHAQAAAVGFPPAGDQGRDAAFVQGLTMRNLMTDAERLRRVVRGWNGLPRAVRDAIVRLTEPS